MSTLPHPAFFLDEQATPLASGAVRRFRATPLCIGPWDHRLCHGGPPCALLAQAIETAPGAEGFQVARLSFELLRPVPVGALELRCAPERRGRSVDRWRAELWADGKVCIEARGLRIRRAAVPVPPAPPVPKWPSPSGLKRVVFPFFTVDIGYHIAVDLRAAHGRWGTTPVGFWGRPLVPLVAGEATSPLSALVILADAQSGMGVPAPPESHTFINPDLHIHLERQPVPGWVGFDIRSAGAQTGMGLAQSALRDSRGAVGRSAQSLLMSLR